MEKLVVASSNAGKIKEIRELLGGRFEIVSMSEAGLNLEIEETGETFKENALIKARAVYAALGENSLADDSGLEVEYLVGAPGVRSARYSGEPVDNVRNRALLLKNMEGAADRSAHFTCAMALILKGGKEIVAEGRTYGKILKSEVGSNGFGYDCVFFSDDLQKSFGQATDEEKNSVSHRARALAALMERMK